MLKVLTLASTPFLVIMLDDIPIMLGDIMLGLMAGTVYRKATTGPLAPAQQSRHHLTAVHFP